MHCWLCRLVPGNPCVISFRELPEAESVGWGLKTDTLSKTYLNIDVPSTEDVGMTMTAAVVAGVEKAGNIDSRIEGRIMRLDSK